MKPSPENGIFPKESGGLFFVYLFLSHEKQMKQQMTDEFIV